ncbi:unnamed protein product, partial [Symbiodinium pilosum]
ESKNIAAVEAAADMADIELEEDVEKPQLVIQGNAKESVKVSGFENYAASRAGATRPTDTRSRGEAARHRRRDIAKPV